ncbi:MinD-like ATPase involved in chromosome partitioning or flagellar assembly [Micromonospora chokoriensis]|uniref:MinD-like ATPase involved in chromosome partitioning or flagellar assembly n=1 Tax=Micromonospora chokoriensis TaxID=356851 RepID=A0A1C4VGE8_9ACTN|nr:MinD-like ATPase involved in chromosome partitioning or flagellar assembly [Micromonospora chokoriensis]
MSAPPVPGPTHSGGHGPHPPQRRVTGGSTTPAAAPRPSSAPARPAPTPRTPGEPARSEADDLSLVRRILPGDPALRRLWRTASRMFTSGRATRELADLAAEVQVPVHTGRRIAVASVHGGAGKTTVAAVLASVFATRRADPVLVADADPYEGSLTWRLGAPGEPPLERLAPHLVAARGGDLRALEPLLPRTGTGLWVLPSGTSNPTLCSEVTRALSRLFAVAVVDCPPGLESRTAAAAMADAHSVVLVAAGTPDGVRATYQALRRIVDGGYGAWLARVVVVLSTSNPDGRTALLGEAARELIEDTGVPVVVLPYDRHLAGGALIMPSRLGEATLVEATRAAGLALATARRM